MNEIKWRIGQVWKARDGMEHTISTFGFKGETYCVYADGSSFTRTGRYYEGQESSRDLVELVKDSDGEQLEDADPVSEQQETPAAPASAYETEFRDRLIIGLAPRAIAEHWSGDNLMDFIDAIMTRRTTPQATV